MVGRLDLHFPQGEVMSIVATTELAKREGSADKVYIVEVVATDGGFMVQGRNGRRGGALKLQPKTTAPVSRDEAEVIAQGLVRAKLKGGYQEAPGVSGGTYVPPASTRTTPGPGVALLSAISTAEADAYLEHSDFIAQEKFDGERRVLEVDAAGITGYNRRGLAVALPTEAVRDLEPLRQLGISCVLDGEHMGDTIVVFDLLEAEGVDLRQEPFIARWERLMSLLSLAPHRNAIVFAPTAMTPQDKRDLYDEVTARGGEGVVFKRRQATYTIGRSQDLLKCKFVETATVRVGGVNAGKRSVMLELQHEGAWHNVGSVTIPANHDIPAPGSLAEVRYLYAYRGGSLYQPIYLGVRDDADEAMATMDQLKFKAETPSLRP
jgi:bifunctional non-homologous end joining protein LigD